MMTGVSINGTLLNRGFREDLEWKIHLLTWDDEWGTHILGQPPNENGYANNNYDNVGKTMS